MPDYPHFNKALEMAQKGGYAVFWNEEMSMYLEAEMDRIYTQREIWSDKRFWKALGVALKDVRRWRRPIETNKGLSSIPAWHFWWIQFIEHLARDKDSEDFFEKIGHE